MVYPCYICFKNSPKSKIANLVNFFKLSTSISLIRLSPEIKFKKLSYQSLQWRLVLKNCFQVEEGMDQKTLFCRPSLQKIFKSSQDITFLKIARLEILHFIALFQKILIYIPNGAKLTSPSVPWHWQFFCPTPNYIVYRTFMLVFSFPKILHPALLALMILTPVWRH